MRKNGYILLAGVVLLIILSTARFRNSQETTGPVTGEQPEVVYDSYAVDVNTVLYNEQGTIEYTLRSDRQTHLLSGITELEEPYLQLYRPSGSRWNLVAGSGRIFPAENSSDENGSAIERIDFSEDVRLFQIDDINGRTTLTTSLLSVFPADRTVETEAVVKVEMGNLEQTAQGVHGNLDEERLSFHANIRGQYAPTTEN